MTQQLLPFEPFRASVRSLMERSSGWSVQGFGMMRTYLDPDKEWRLNVWDSSLQVPGVSTIHDHPWHFQSWVLSGRFTNTRFGMFEFSPSALGGSKYDYMVIKTGEGGGPSGEKQECVLLRQSREAYGPGDSYGQTSEEIHESTYEDGTVTLNRRTRVGTGEHARVFWPHGTQWVDAMPRSATDEEVQRVLSRAKEKW